MKKKTKRAGAKAKLAPKKTKRIVKAKGGKVGTVSGFTLKVTGKLATGLATAAGNDTAFKGSNARSYAINLLKKTASI